MHDLKLSQLYVTLVCMLHLSAHIFCIKLIEIVDSLMNDCFTTVLSASQAVNYIFHQLSEGTGTRGRSQKFVFFGGWIKLLNSRSDVILPHKKFTWADFFGGINTNIHPRRSLRPCWHQTGYDTDDWRWG